MDETATTFTDVHVLRELPDHFPSTQLHLWELRQFPWHKARQVPFTPRRRQPMQNVQQGILFPEVTPVRRRQHVR